MDKVKIITPKHFREFTALFARNLFVRAKHDPIERHVDPNDVAYLNANRLWS